MSEEDDAMEPRQKEAEMLYAQEVIKEAGLKNPRDYKVSPQVTAFLASKYIHSLKKKSTKFPRARWFCRLCEYYCDNLTKCGEHFRDNRHSRISRTHEIETTLHHLPKPNEHHLESLNSLLLQVEKEYGLSQAELEKRQTVAVNLHGLLNRHIPGCIVRLYGSSLSGFGLKTSNVNLDLQIVAEVKPHLALLKTLEVLQNASEYTNVMDDFTAGIPHIKFTTGNGLDCRIQISLNNCNAYETSSLLADYWKLDRRVRVLGVCFRYWSHTTHLDRQAEGTLPPHAFAILLIYFLQQQTNPVLPCIHELISGGSEFTYISPKEFLTTWRTQNIASPVELWIELFRFYSIDFKMSQLVVSIKKSGFLTCDDKQWKSKRLAVEDPFSPKRSLCRSIQANSVYDYIKDCFKTGYLYFGTIQTRLGPIITSSLLPDSDSVPSPSTSKEVVVPTGLTLESWILSHGTILTEKEAMTASRLVPKNMIVFSFPQKKLTNGQVPAVQCCVCGQRWDMSFFQKDVLFLDICPFLSFFLACVLLNVLFLRC